jgi:hypothetical protein
MQEVVMAHVEENELTLYLNGALELDRVKGIEGHLCDCPDCKQKLDQTLHFITKLADLGRKQRAFPTLEKRREPRFASDSAMSLQLLRPLSFERLTGRINNVSRGGMAIRLAKSLERGTLVQVRVGTVVLLGEVRHCSKVGEEFSVGVQLEDVMES